MKNLIPALFVLAFTAASAHAQSQSGANSYNVPMFAGQVGQTYASAQSDCVQCGIIADSEFASFGDEGSTLPMQAGSGSGYTIYPVTKPTLAASVTVTVESFCSVNGGCTIQYSWNDSEGAIAN